MQNRTPKKSYKNTTIELLRIILTLAICMHHFRLYSQSLPFGGGYLATDSFFVISGYYLLSWIHKNRAYDKLPLRQYIGGRIKRLYPQYLYAIIVSFLMGFFVLKRRFDGTIIGYISELFMLPFGNNSSSERIIPPDWYITYLIIASVVIFIFLWIFRKDRRLTIYGCLFIAVLCGGVMIIRFDSLCLFPSEQALFSIESLLRAVFDINLGVLLNILFISVKGRNHTHNGNGAIKTVFAVLLIADMYFLFWYTGWNRLDYVHIIIFSVILIISMLINGNMISDRIDELICNASSLCYMIYLNHYVVASMFDHYDIGRKLDWKLISVLYILCVFTYVAFMRAVQICAFSLFRKITS